MNTALPNDTFAPTATEPLFGRGAEYEAVLRFVQDRLLLVHCKSLFVFGACGTGKTSTVLRALRAISDRVMSIDRPQRASVRGRKTIRAESDVLDANWEDASEAPPLSRASVLLSKHPRLDSSGAEQRASQGRVGVRTSSSASSSSRRCTTRASCTRAQCSTTARTGTRSSSSSHTHDTTAATMEADAEKYSVPYFAAHYAALFAARPSTRTSTRGLPGGARRVQGHYVNCADLSAAALVAAIVESMRVAFPRPDADTRALREAIAQLAQREAAPSAAAADYSAECESPMRRSGGGGGSRTLCTPRRSVSAYAGRSSSSTRRSTTHPTCNLRSSNSGKTTRTSTASSSSSSAAASSSHAALQVVVLDEVEYARPAARATISALATLSATSQHAVLALVFISNQRDLVHVPQMLLQELPFQAYSVDTLKHIAERCMTSEVGRLMGSCVQTGPSAGHTTRRTSSARASQSSSSSGRTSSAAAPHAAMQISPSLYEYIARKALLDFSGDVRQVCAMCRHVVQGALGREGTCPTRGADTQAATMNAAAASAASNTKGTHAATMLPRDSTTLTSLVDSYDAARTSTGTHASAAQPSCDGGSPSETPSAARASTLSSSSSSSSSSASSSTNSGSSTAAAATTAASTHRAAGEACTKRASNSAATSTTITNSTHAGNTAVKPCATITLASSVAALKQNAVEEQLHQHVATMPEQMLYVLCCLIVLTLRNVQAHAQALTAIGGATGRRSSAPRRVGLGITHSHHTTSSSSSSATLHGNTPMSTALKVREVHQLYTALMGQRHFPSMNGAGVRLAVDGLADLGILTRPQRRGNEEVFSFNGVWSVTAVQAALAQRGEALRTEMAACGLDGSENKFVTVLCDLKSLAHVTL